MIPSKTLERIGPVLFETCALTRVSITMTEPFRISSGEVAEREALLLRISNAVAFGWGESSPMPAGFYSPETPDSCQAELLDTVLPAVMGRRFESMLALTEALEATGASRFATVAVETAAWELLARERGVSLRTLFGLPERAIPSGLAVGLYETTDELLDAIARYRVWDYLRLKIKIKRGADVELVRRVRAVMPDFPLYVDANADYSMADIAVFEQLDKANLMMFEQPFAKGDLVGMAELSHRMKTPVCIDESAETRADVVKALEANACGIVNIKLQRVGGFLEAMRIIELCEARRIPLWMGTMPELGVGSAQALVLAAHPAFVFPTDVEPSTRWYRDDILAPELHLASGQLAVPAGPGLGFTVDEAKLERYAVRSWML